MKIYAKKVLAQKRYRLKIHDPLAGGPGRISKLAEIEANAVEFAENMLWSMEIPEAPQVTLGRLKGFEDVNVDFQHVVGVATIHASFNSLSGVTIRMSFPIPIVRGEFQKPSMVVINGKKHVFSQAFLDKILDAVEGTRPKAYNVPNPSRGLMHEEVVNRGLFAGPDIDESFLDLVVNKYSVN